MCSIKVLDYVNKFAKSVFRPTPQIAWECHVVFQVAEALYKLAMIQDLGILFFLWSKKVVISIFFAFLAIFHRKSKYFSLLLCPRVQILQFRIIAVIIM